MRHPIACRVPVVLIAALSVFSAFAATAPAAPPFEPFLDLDTTTGELPVSVALDKVGNVWVSLQPRCEVRKYSPTGTLLQATKLVEDCTGEAGASGLAVDAAGLLYAAVKGPASVRGVYVVDGSGVIDRLPGTEQILFPNSLAFDHHNGTMYVTDMLGFEVWRVPVSGVAELWASGPAFTGLPVNGIIGGPNGLAVDHDSVLVSVTFLPRLVRIPIADDGSAGVPVVVYPPPALFGASMFALDDIALDVHGNVYASVVAGIPGGIAFLARDGTQVSWRVSGFPGAVTSAAFGTGKGDRETLFVAVNAAFGGTVSGIYKADVGVPGRPLP
ncbi:MAG: SMP-30/gluconolactonase/LRE family protein [Betaproteobacteria bacterium]